MTRRKAKKTWEQWIEQYTSTAPTLAVKSLPIEAPPCATCVYWNPERQELGVSVEIVLCRRDEIYPDFSCYEGSCYEGKDK